MDGLPFVAGALVAAALAGRLIARRPAFFVRLGAGDEADIVGHVIVIGDDYSAHRIDRDSAPVGAAIIARIFDRAAVAGRRCVEALVARLAELDATDQDRTSTRLNSSH